MGSATTVEEARALIDKYEGIIFDNDGTVVDSMPVYYRAWRAALTAHGLSFPEEQFYALAGKSARSIVDLLNEEQGKTVLFDDIQAAKAVALEKEFASIQAITPVFELVKYAKESGKRIAIASGGHRTNVLRSLVGIGLKPREFFDTVVTTEDVTKGKPDPETFLLTAQRLGVAPEKCIGFEDGDLGLVALRAAKMVDIDVRKFEGYPVPDGLK